MYKIGDVVKGYITGVQKYGIFVAVDEDYTGLIHISEISHAYVKNINDYLNDKDIIEAKVIEVDEKNKHLKLSIKNLNNNKEEFFTSKKGFKSLKENLKPWMDEKLAELKND